MRRRAVGWVERSETHEAVRCSKAMGFAKLNPSYGLTDEFQSCSLACAQALPKLLFGVGRVFNAMFGSVLFWSGLDRALKLPLTRIAAQSDLSPLAGRG